MRLPDFIIGGAPRSGTTWLYAVADRHPDLALAKPVVPEPKFFLRDDLYQRGLKYYSDTWFASIPRDKLAGEKSTNYLESASAAERIHSCIPAVRLLFVLRNPVDRAYSNFLWSRQNGMETVDFKAALTHEQEREQNVPESLRYARPHALFSRGLYAELLQPYFERFPAEQIHVLRYEDIVAEPGAVAESMHHFLGVAARPQDGASQTALNASTETQDAVMDPSTRQQLASRYAGANAKLYRLLGPNFRAWSD